MQQDRGHLARAASFVRWLLFAALVAAAGLVVCRQLISSRLDEEIRHRLETMLAAHYADLEVRIEGARRLEGKGIEVRGLSIRTLHEGTRYRDLVYIDEMFLQCRADLGELLSGRPDVRSLTLRRMKLHATCHQDRRWNIAALLPLPDFGGSIPKVIVEDSTLQLQDLCRQAGGEWSLRDIDVQTLIRRDAQGHARWEFAGNLLGDHYKHVQIQRRLDPQQDRWSAWGTIDGLEMSQRLLDALPNDIAQYGSLVATLRARAHFEFQLGHDQEHAEPFWVVARGHVSEGRVEDPRLPLPLTDVEADVFCSNQEIRLEQVTARSGPTTLQMDCRCEHFLSAQPHLQLSATIGQLPLDERLLGVLPEQMRDDWQHFAPQGMVDASVGVQLAAGKWHPDITVNCRDVSFAYYKFPLRLRQARGVIRWVGNQVKLDDFTATAGNQTLHVTGQFADPGPQATGFLELHTDGPVALDETLIAAMNETGQQIVRSLHPAGGVTLTRGRIEKLRPGDRPTSRWELAFEEGSIQYDRFPYAIHSISGRLVLENRRWEFSDFRGHHGSCYITCEGGWMPMYADRPGGDLTLRFRGWDVPLNDSLRNAVGRLNKEAEKFWSSMQPRGSADYTDITVHYNSLSKHTQLELTAEKWPPEQNVAGRSITIHPTWFPLQLNACTGRVRFSNGHFVLENVTAQRGDSQLELAGEGDLLPEQTWRVTLSRLIADSLTVDRELIDALPESVRRGLRQLQYRGTLGLNGNGWLRGSASHPVEAGWDVLLDIENGALDSTLQLDHIYGGVRLTGGKDAQGFRSRGMLEVDSVIAHGTQLTELQGPLWIDAQQLLLGSRASVVRPGSPPQQVTAKAMGGTVALDAHVVLDDPLRFAVDLSLSNGEVTEVARSVHAQPHDISGKVFALLRLKGDGAGLHTLQGTGQVRLRQADIYELPLIARLLNLLSENPDATGFTSSDVDFRLQGEQIYFDRIDFLGDVISLKGNGWMDLNRHVNLDFYALVGSEQFQIPVIHSLLAQASRNILLIQVVGNIDNPQVIKKPLPELDDTLQRLFPEAVPRTAER